MLPWLVFGGVDVLFHLLLSFNYGFVNECNFALSVSLDFILLFVAKWICPVFVEDGITSGQ